MPDIAASDANGCGSKNGAAIASGSHPSSIIHAVSVFCGNGGAQRRSSTVPMAHDTAAPMIKSAPTGARRTLRDFLAQQDRHAAHADEQPREFARESGSCRSQNENSTLQIGRV